MIFKLGNAGIIAPIFEPSYYFLLRSHITVLIYVITYTLIFKGLFLYL